MRRAEDWPERLAAYLDARRERAWERGIHDCGGFVRGWLIEATGYDPFRVIGEYYGRDQAVALLRSYGGLEKVLDHIAAADGIEEIHPKFARRGDVGLARDVEEGVGIIVQGGLAIAEEVGGWSVLPRNYIVRAWRIG